MRPQTLRKESYLQTKWRPMVAWLYILICFCDFVLFPVLWSGIQAWKSGQVSLAWDPLTLKGAGLLHLSFGAILGIAAHGRSQEKINGMAALPELPQVVTTFATPTSPTQYAPGNTSAPIPAPIMVSRSGKPGPILDEPEQ